MNAAVQPQTEVNPAELADLCALDDDLFARTFFPEAMRQATPAMHGEVDALLNNPAATFCNVVLPRDFAKTTKLRIFAAKRIAYGLSRTILYIAASEPKVLQNILWLRTRIEAQLQQDQTRRPSLLAQIYGLQKGSKWTDTELQIQHRLLEHPIWVLGVGITSESIRGINFDNYRPDLIILDDILTDENGGSAEQREKLNNLVMGAVKNSLAPKVDAANAKMVMMNTPQNADDVAARAEVDPEWRTIRRGCWTEETKDESVDLQESAWPERHPTATLRFQKKAATIANRLSVFTREKECKIIARELCMFRDNWLNFFAPGEEPQTGLTILAIDPVPPPTEGEVKKKQVNKKDYEVIGVWRRYGQNFYLIDGEAMRGHQPSWTRAKVFELAVKWRATSVHVEGVGYQKALKFILQEEMQRRQFWLTVHEFTDIRSKPLRINSILSGPGQNGRIFVRNDLVEFIKQWNEYPNVEHEDWLDMGAMGVAGLSKPWMDAVDEKGQLDNSNVVPLRTTRMCP